MVSRYLIVAIVAGVITSQSGCLTLSSFLGQKRKPGYDLSMLGYQVPPGGMPSPVPDSVSLSGNDVILEIRGSDKQMAVIPLNSSGSMTVEELAAKAQLVDKLGHAKLFIMRPTDSVPVRLDCSLDSKGRCVNPGQNYGLRPGDHIIAMDDGRSLFERYVDEKLGRN